MAVLGKRRMFNANFMKQKSFMDLPDNAKILYVYLGLEADDDGIVSAYPVMKSLGSSEDSLKLLMAKGFILPLNEDYVIFLTDWHIHNELDPKKKRDSMYRPLLEEKYPEYRKRLVTPHYKSNRNSENPEPVIDVDVKTVKEEVNDYYKRKENKRKENSPLPKQRDEVKQNVKSYTKPDFAEDHCYGKYKNIVLLPDEYEEVITWKHYDKLLDLVSGVIQESDRVYRSHYNLLRREAKKQGWYIRKPIFGMQKNLLLSKEEFLFLDQKYLEVESKLDTLADRVIGKEIEHPLSYIQKVAEMEGWKLRSQQEEEQFQIDIEVYEQERKQSVPMPEDLRKKIEEMRRQRG